MPDASTDGDSTEITVKPIGFIVGGRDEAIDDQWGPVQSTIALDGNIVGPDATAGLEEFSHIEVVFVFDRVSDAEITRGARHPRGRVDWPAVGILAQRAKVRPNRIGVTVCELLAVDGYRLLVKGLDAIDATPVLDVKAVHAGFRPTGSGAPTGVGGGVDA